MRSATPTPLVTRSLAAVALAAGLLLSATGPAQAARLAVDGQPRPFPEDGVLFGEPPARGEAYAVYQPPADRTTSSVLAEFEVGGGMVRFVDEGDGVATVIAGDRDTFAAVAEAETVAQLFKAVAPPRTAMPAAVAEVGDERIDTLAWLGRQAGFTFDDELLVGEDDWADGCAGDSFDQWESGFGAWHGFLWGSDVFSVSDHYAGGATVGDLNGYFGTLDEIWFGTCLVEGIVSSVQMERRVYDIGFPDGEGGFLYGAWAPIAGTEANLSPGQRYLYHNHSIYSSLRRSEIRSIGSAGYTGWEYFISGAAADGFEPDDQYQAPAG